MFHILRRNEHYHHVARIAIQSAQKMSGSGCACAHLISERCRSCAGGGHREVCSSFLPSVRWKRKGGNRRSGQRVPVGHDLILTCVRWDVASLESSRPSEERRQERGVTVTPTPIHDWLPQASLPLAEVFPQCKHLVWISWRIDAPLVQSQDTGALLCGGAGSPDDELSPQRAARGARGQTLCSPRRSVGMGCLQRP